MSSVAVVGLACRYPDARTPAELWENVLAERRAFRPIPPERLSLADYGGGRAEVDRTYATEAAVLEGWEFDRVRFRVSGESFRAADPAHWLALEVAAEALADAGFADGAGLPRRTTAVLVGNSLTGEFSRAGTLRLRWPYVRRVLAASLRAEGIGGDVLARLLASAEAAFKAPFPAPGGETLAGGLSNTIAGRICNHFDLKGGGWTVDGACASSLLAITEGCSALAAGEADVVLAGGVDLSLDPFELVGFARAGALADGEMRVYDRRSAGFIPGEGCGFAVLMRHGDAVALRRAPYAVVRGWGVSTDGAGGLTRPEVEGQLLALERAYARAGFGPDAVALFEGHGTGTEVGDATELRVLSAARRAAGARDRAAVGSVKAIFGHTKAAAGIAGFIKAAMAVHARVLPPTAGCREPHPELESDPPVLRVLADAEPWPEGAPLRAAVSAMGFGGINAHVVMEGIAPGPRRALDAATRALARSRQDAELFLFSAADPDGLVRQIEVFRPRAAALSRAELGDASAALARALEPDRVRAAVVASTAAELARGLDALRGWIGEGVETRIDARSGVCLGTGDSAPRIGFLFPGQGSPAHLGGGLLRRRFPVFQSAYLRADSAASEAVYEREPRSERGAGDEAVPARRSFGRTGFRADAGSEQRPQDDSVSVHWHEPQGCHPEEPPRQTVGVTSAGAATKDLRTGSEREPGNPQECRFLHPSSGDGVATQVAQPAIAAASAAGLALLREMGIEAEVGLGHSLGDLVALHWAGAMPLDALLRTATVRGAAMGALDGPAGAMLALSAGRSEAERLIAGTSAVVAGVNAPARTVVAGDAASIETVAERAGGRGIEARRLAVSHAFHSPLVAPAAEPLARHLQGERFMPLVRAVASTVSGGMLSPDADLRALLVRQITTPVLFLDALTAVRGRADLWIECGPGHALSALAAEIVDAPVIALDAGGPSIGGLLAAVGAAFALGAPVRTAALFDGRFTRPIDLSRPPRFLVNPCEMAPPLEGADELAALRVAPVPPEELAAPANGNGGAGENGSTLDLVRELVARRAELPAAAVRDGDRLLGDLHLNSIIVGELVAEASRRLGRRPPAAPTEYATATVEQVARALDELEATSAAADDDAPPAGVDAWVRPFAVEWAERPLPKPADFGSGDWRIMAPDGDPLARELADALDRLAPGGGIAIHLPPDPDDSDALRLLEAAHALADAPARFVVAQHSGGASAFAGTVHLESGAAVCVVDLPEGDPEAAGRVAAEAASARGFRHARYDADGRRWEPFVRVMEDGDDADLPLGPGDVLLATGGGKGITAECALALARRTGAALALLGRSRPEDDAALAANLERVAAAGVRCRYLSADVTDPAAVRAAVREAEAALGPVTGVLHGAALNVPRLLSALDGDELRATLAPKVAGLENVLAALDADRLKLLAAFGSIIGRMGLAGSGAYALANEWLRRRVERFAAAHPGCRCRTLEWSVWADVGMGARLGRVDALLRAGVSPVTPDEGVRAFLGLLARPSAPVSVVVAGRFGAPPTLRVEERELPLRRFLERPLVHYPGVELVAEAELSADTDPYLDDHALGGERLLPAVMGLEAMAQAAMALAGADRPPVFEDVRFDRPVAVPGGGRVRVRVAALARAPGRVDVVLRSSSTGFAADHFRATCRFGAEEETRSAGAMDGAGDAVVPLDPGRELYGGILFHRGRFRRVARYRRLQAFACVADVAPDGVAPWFGAWLPAALVLGDPGARDAAIHAIQPCIPHAQVLPVGVARLAVLDANGGGARTVAAREVAREGSELVYDLEVTDAAGRLAERWEGLRLRIVAPLAPGDGWPPALLGPYAERCIAELVPGLVVSVAVDRGDGERRARSDGAVRRALGAAADVRRRPDGRPEVDASDTAVSAAHAGALTLAVAGAGPLGCDLEPVAPRPALAWRDLLGPARADLAALVAGEAREDADTASTRVWAAAESLKKAGAPPDAPLVLDSIAEDGWMLLRSGALAVATWAGPVRRDGSPAPMVLAVLGNPQIDTRGAEQWVQNSDESTRVVRQFEGAGFVSVSV
ncbi:MAG TPA: SDR family NAD(P)-dependent oxidoreductase [Longimicrobium sp.]|jgi:acyl transferase domain-containing protein/NADP-dependent 3-hydroxy acid dehydrogenase YdfG